MNTLRFEYNNIFWCEDVNETSSEDTNVKRVGKEADDAFEIDEEEKEDLIGFTLFLPLFSYQEDVNTCLSSSDYIKEFLL